MGAHGAEHGGGHAPKKSSGGGGGGGWFEMGPGAMSMGICAAVVLAVLAIL